MAAYAALVSLMHIIDKIERHPSPPISLHKQQVESLTEKVNFLQKFLEDYHSPFDYSDEADPLEVRIADATHAAEDVIEIEIVDRIHSRSTILGRITNFCKLLVPCECAGTGDDFNEDLEKVIEEMELIKKDVMEMVREKAAVEPQLQRNVSADAGERNNMMVGCDDVLLQLMDRLTRGNSDRQIIPIVGMGGIGKTTLAKNVFGNALIKEHFDVCVWATISQNYNVEEALGEVLSQVGRNSSDKSVNELGEELHKYLCRRRYLIVMDDMWSLEVWDKMRFFFPEYSNGSRVLVTTRLSNLATHLTHPNSLLDMKSLDEISSWTLFSKTVFGEGSFPRELERVGKEIVEKCKGLPLSIVVIGGLMAKSRPTIQYWEHIDRNLRSMLNSENDEYCLKILKMSYNHLPAYLKPCFLYMGMFKEDSAIRVSKLVKLWVSEGFLKPINNKSLETIAKEYLKELVDRNLIQVDKLGVLGNMKYCKVHDLLRDISLKEAQKQRFYYVIVRRSSIPGINSQRRIVIPDESNVDCVDMMCAPQARSFVCDDPSLRGWPDCRLLRTLDTRDAPNSKHSLKQVVRFVNSRYMFVHVNRGSKMPSSISQLWNLHALIIRPPYPVSVPNEIWKMPQLRHVEFKPFSFLADPPTSKDDFVVMENLHTLKGVYNFKLSEEVVKRIPNIKKLGIFYGDDLIAGVNYCSYLHRLETLETLYCSTKYGGDDALQKVIFPQFLKKLTLEVSSGFELEDILQKIGSLPLLHKLLLKGGVFTTRKWETVDGQFSSLRVLELSECEDLEEWTVSESSHFPLLQMLHLRGLGKLKEIPSEIGEVATLKSILVGHCSESVVVSAKTIVEEQEDLHGEQIDLRVRVVLPKEEEEIQSLASPNFEVEVKGGFYGGFYY